MAQPAPGKLQQVQQDSSFITSAARRKRRESTPLAEIPTPKEGSTPLTRIFPQAKKARRATPSRFTDNLHHGIQEQDEGQRLLNGARDGEQQHAAAAASLSTRASTPSQRPAADLHAASPDVPATPISIRQQDSTPARTRQPTPVPRPASSAKSHDSDLDSYDQHDTENQVQGSGAKERSHNRRSPSPKAEASILEQGADGVPGKSGSPGRSILGSGDVQAVPSTDADTTTSLNDRALCVLGAREDSDSVDEPDLEVVAFDDEELEGEEEAFDPYAFIKGLPPLAQCTAPGRRVLLPRQTRRCKRKTLVLDLDETLVHSSLQEEVTAQPDFVFPVAFNGRDHMVQVRKRPHLKEFLERCAELFEVVVFTASQKIYAQQLLDVIDPARRLIRHRIFRDSCVFVEGNYLKDLSALGRELAHTLIIDNSVQAFGFQLRNGIPIESWYDDEDDRELLRLLPFLERCAAADDVRPLIANEFKVEQLVANAAGNYYAPMSFSA